ncbi:MAG: GNAT family N-acetyltransferase [Dehalococcoidales bacterium]|nr:GNAT family N-acetyltransferase [Dehalococcoidales bacterium]
MAVSPYNIRSYRTADFNEFVLLFQEAEQREPIGRPNTPQAILAKFSHPTFTVDDDLLIVESDGKIIGFMDMLPELGIKRVIVDCWLKPEHRRNGLGRKLLKLATKRARDLGAGFLHVIIGEENKAAVTILASLGFEKVREYYEMTLDLKEVDGKELMRASRGCRPLGEGEEEMLVDIQRRSFVDHWGYNPDTPETMEYNMSLSHRSPRDIILSCKEDDITGYCWTEVAPGGQGRIFMIGSDPDYRGRGIGRKLLLAGLANLKNKGVAEVGLTVDSENQAACSLYESVGFVPREGYLWYEKPVN